MDAMKQVSLQSVQALLVLSNLDYGGGQAHQFWNLMALCKRMNTSLGMRDLVTNQGDNFNKLSTVPPRMLPLPDTIIDREERIRAYGMTEILDGASTLGVAWNLGISPPEGTAILPCSDSIWKFPQHIISVWSFGDFHFSSAFSLCIILVASELCHVHRFLQKSVDTRVHDQRLKWQQESQQLDERLTAWRGEFVAAVCLINAEYVQEERAEFDPNIVLTNCILDTAVIALFQRLAPSPIGIDNYYEAWPYATNRCLYACDDMTAKIRQVRDKELENSSPHLIYSMFVAARFYLVYAKTVAADIPRNLHLLAYALRICGERWVLARRYETVIRTAVAEHHMPIGVMSSLPVQFFDLQYSTLDIDEALRIWVANIMPSGASGPGMGASGELNGVS
ncbi:hypothetical protein PV05_02514 [Exophiala xenobiotica]|uniref:Transcription factor domain-containing protein n=1 Tax=Exophiala xenobiotica TaxID=348802 RepID=A0A0D2ETA0_9EURO|nr:uncharacterized protein PV05_02514 [Exophiala xenobiotica]KIW57960.1 hypothetical protein PV05_02514 [Exophiala xenobiotica]